MFHDFDYVSFKENMLLNRIVNKEFNGAIRINCIEIYCVFEFNVATFAFERSIVCINFTSKTSRKRNIKLCILFCKGFLQGLICLDGKVFL